MSTDPLRVRAIFDSIASRYDLANAILSFGIHRWWQRRLLKILEKNTPTANRGVVLDLCTGTGALLGGLQKLFGKVIGIDFSEAMLDRARGHCQKSGLTSIDLIKGDALNLSCTGESIDAITIAYGVRNLASLEGGLNEMYRVLKPDGKVFILEFGKPGLTPFSVLYRVYATYCLPFIGGLLTGNRGAYDYLKSTSLSFPAGKDFCSIMEQCGFSNIQFEQLSGGIAYIYWGQKR